MNLLPNHSNLSLSNAALLLGIFENSEYTPEQLIELGYSKRTVEAVKIIHEQSKGKTSEFQIVNEIIFGCKGNTDVLKLKMAEMWAQSNSILPDSDCGFLNTRLERAMNYYTVG